MLQIGYFSLAPGARDGRFSEPNQMILKILLFFIKLYRGTQINMFLFIDSLFIATNNSRI